MKRKNIINVTVVAAALLACAGAAFAASTPGSSAFQFLQLGVGARPSAMGETFAGAADDVNALYWNPAGLAGLKSAEASMTHALWLEGITYSNLAYARPALGGTIGAAFNVLNSGNIQEADSGGTRLSENYSLSDKMGLISYARSLGGVKLGANLKYISSSIEEESASAVAADVGVMYNGFPQWGRNMRVGLAVQNLGTKAKYVSEEKNLPATIRAGGALDLRNDLLIASDLVYVEKGLNIHVGAEYTRPVGKLVLAARAGYKSDTAKELGALSGLTAGLGVKWNGCQIDYAWNSFTDLGVTHRISLGLKFGAKKDTAAVKKSPESVPAAPVPAPAPAAAAAPVKPADADADGVPDALDKCPGTPAGTPVDASGCKQDADSDGVADVFDNCPGTPVGAAVDATGCSVPAASAPGTPEQPAAEKQ